MKRCFGYVRVSTVKQGDGVSLAAQREAILAFASRHDLEIVKWFEEKETAAKKGRPIFNKMMTELRRGQATGLVIHKIDRSARNFADWAKIGDLADAGIDIHFATESLDFRSRGGRLTADIQAVIAADYIRNLREETLKGIRGRLKQGLYPFQAPIGYLDNGGGKPKTPDPDRAPYVRLAYELYASGCHSFRSLHAELARRGFTTKAGHPLSLTGLETLLDNPFYCGVIQIKSTAETYQGVHEAIVSPSLFARVQALKSGRTIRKVTRHDFAYRRLFRCIHCNNSLIPERQKGHVYYRCQTGSCVTKTVREEVLEGAVHACLQACQLNDVDVAALTAGLGAWRDDKRSAAASDGSLQIRLVALRDRLNRLTDALLDEVIDRNTFNERKTALVFEESSLLEELANAQAALDGCNNIDKFLELAKSLDLLFQSAVGLEKGQIAMLATSNRRVEGKEAYVEPADWLVSLKQTASALSGPPSSDTARTLVDRICRGIGISEVGSELVKFHHLMGRQT